MATRPGSYVNWTDGSSSKITQPPTAVSTQGFVPGQPPAAQYVNWILYTLDQWCQYLDGRTQGGSGGSAGVTSNARLLNGGTWGLSGTTLQWSAAFNIAIPGQADANNQVAAGAISLNDGQVGYVQLNVPFTYTATTTSGSTSLTNLSSTSGLTTGMAVTGAGIPASTTVSSISGSTVVISNAATASANGVSITFQSSGALTMQASDESALSAGPQTCIVARNNGGMFLIGVGSFETTLRTGETKTLRGSGFGPTFTGTAGFALTAGQLCYVSPGGSPDASRAAGSVFTCDVSSATMATNPCRAQAVGIAAQSTASGQLVTLVTNGVIGGFSGLTVGGYIWASASAPGGITQTAPNTINANAVVLVGVAISATQIQVRLPSQRTDFAVNPTFGTLSASTLATATLNATSINVSTNGTVSNPVAAGTIYAPTVSAGTVLTSSIRSSTSGGRPTYWAPEQTILAAGVIATNGGVVSQTGWANTVGLSASWRTSLATNNVIRCDLNFTGASGGVNNTVPSGAIITFSPQSAGTAWDAGYALNPQGANAYTQISLYFYFPGGSAAPVQFSYQVIIGPTSN